MLPKIHSLSLNVKEGLSDEIFLKVLCPGLKQLEVLMSDLGEQMDATICSLAGALRRGSDSLERLGLHHGIPETPMSLQAHKGLCGAIGAQLRLRRLELSYSGTDLVGYLRAASHLQYLSSLSLQTWDPTIPSPGDVPSGFAALRTLETATIPMQSLPGLTSPITSTHLESLRLVLDGAARVGDEFACLGRFRSLVRVDVHIQGELEWADVVAFLSSGGMTFFSLRATRTSTIISDERLDTIAKAWPHLTELYLLDRGSVPIPGVSATLAGLTCFAKHCPLLEVLHILVDATEMVVPVSPTETGPAVIDLSLDESVADKNSENIASFISQMWPNHSKTRDRTYHPRQNVEQRKLWEQIWKKVDENLEAR